MKRMIFLRCQWWLEEVEVEVGFYDCDDTRHGCGGFPVCFIEYYT